MPKTLKVHIGTVDMLTFTPCEDNPGTVDAEVVLRIEGVSEDTELLGGVGKPAVLARHVSDLFEMTGPERAVIAAAEGWYDRMQEVYGGRLGGARGTWVEPIFLAVKALRDAEGK